jgi:hypothetical protein
MDHESTAYDGADPPLAAHAEPRRSASGVRPGCVSVYAIFLGAGALFLGPAVMLSVLLAMIGRTTANLPVARLSALMALALAGTAIAVGLWRLRTWARLGAMALQGLVILATLAGVVVLWDGADAAVLVPGAVIAVGLSGCALAWFAAHREAFA